MNQREIGGFLELEMPKYSEYHKNAIKINSARNCLLYILSNISCSKIYIPIYICESIVNTILKIGLNYEFYGIDERFRPINDIQLNKDEYILYVNYFGINNELVCELSDIYNNIIIDNTQAFFYNLNRKDKLYIYSARKFFGVSDGAYLIGDIPIKETMIRESSFERMQYLLKRIDCSASEAYTFFKENEEYLDDAPIMNMSRITERILSGVDYNSCKSTRNSNFIYLHDELNGFNELEINIKNIDGPMIYPFLVKDNSLKEILILNKIYIATYWNEVLNRCEDSSFEAYLTKNLIPIPIDQRYSTSDMECIVKIIKENLI